MTQKLTAALYLKWMTKAVLSSQMMMTQSKKVAQCMTTVASQ